jgi:translation initiation factor 3 subunit D
VARTVVHAVSRKGKIALTPKEQAAAGGGITERPAYLSLLSLLEYDPKVAGTTPWSQIIESQRGNVIATEIKNNAFKLGKTAACAMLAGADLVKLGFVSRVTRSDPDSHVLLGLSSVPPSQLASQLGMSPANAWGVLRWFIDLVRKHAKNLQEDTPEEDYVAKFVLLRDPNKPSLHFYSVAPEFGEGGEGEGAGAGEGEGEGEGAGWARGQAQ